MQKALQLAKEPYFSVFINSIRPQLDKLKTLNFGVKLYNKLISLYPDLLNKNKKKKENNMMINPNMMNINPYVNLNPGINMGMNMNINMNPNMNPIMNPGMNMSINPNMNMNTMNLNPNMGMNMNPNLNPNINPNINPMMNNFQMHKMPQYNFVDKNNIIKGIQNKYNKVLGSKYDNDQFY